MMKSAIDIGSNTVRLLVGEVDGGQVQVIRGEVRTTRLATGKQRWEPLAAKAKERTLAALKEFQQILTATYPQAMPPVVVATSALREAADGAQFAQEIERRWGWPVQIVPGEQEAYLSYCGASSVMAGPVMVLDVGGGSSELIWPLKDGRLEGHSVPLGAVRLAEHPLSPPALAAALDFGVASFPALPLVGVGGTITTLAALALQLTVYQRQAVHGFFLTKETLLLLQQQIASCPLAARASRWPMLKERSDIILPGLEIVLQVMNMLQVEKICVSDAGLLDGILLNQAG